MLSTINLVVDYFFDNESANKSQSNGRDPATPPLPLLPSLTLAVNLSLPSMGSVSPVLHVPRYNRQSVGLSEHLYILHEARKQKSMPIYRFLFVLENISRQPSPHAEFFLLPQARAGPSGKSIHSADVWLQC